MPEPIELTDPRIARATSIGDDAVLYAVEDPDGAPTEKELPINVFAGAPVFVQSRSTYRINNVSGTYTAFKNSGVKVSTGSDLTAVWDAVMTDIGSDPADVIFGKGIFAVDSTLAFDETSNVSIQGQGIGATNIQGSLSLPDTSSIFEHRATNSESSHLLDATAIGDQSITTSTVADAGNYLKGDKIVVYNNEDIPNVASAGRKKGQMFEVEADGNPITGVIAILGSIDETWLIGTVPQVIKLDPFFSNISLSKLTIENLNLSPASQPLGTVYFQFVENLSVTECQFINGKEASLRIQQCINTRIINCDFDGVGSAFGNDYGVEFRGGVGVLISACTFEGKNTMRHAVTNASDFTSTPALYNYSRGLLVDSCIVNSTKDSGLDTHAGGKNTVFSNNVIENSGSSGINLRSEAVVNGNTILDSTGDGVNLTDNADESIIANNRIIRGGGTGIDTGGMDKLVVSDNFITGMTGDAMEIAGSLNSVFLDNSSFSNGVPAPTSVESGSIVTRRTSAGYKLQVGDDTADSGFEIVNSDGGFSFFNGTGVANTFFPEVKMFTKNQRSGRISVIIPDAENSGTTGTVILQAKTDVPNDITTRPILGVFNNATKLCEVSAGGDLEINTLGSGLIFQSPNGSRFRLTVDNAGVLGTTAL